MASYLVGTSEIAELLGVSRQRADRITKDEPNFPEPEASLNSGRVWSRQAVLTWARMRGRDIADPSGPESGVVQWADHVGLADRVLGRKDDAPVKDLPRIPPW